MKPGGSMQLHKGSPIISILSRLNTIPRIDTYLFTVQLCLRLPKGLFPEGSPVKTLKTLPPFSILDT